MRPEDYVPPQVAARRAREVPVPEPTWWQRVQDPVVMTGIVAVAVAWAFVAYAYGRREASLYSGLLLGLGLAALLRPGWGMYFGSRWEYAQEPVPSRAALVMTRFSGVVMCAAAVAFSL
ncbi:hypothetical protein [Kineosporia sp. A_224]|uniref:hypothetical protein n=1 Tax=Kineosporia sp. A_224 TaxID=1962180 RepID=UPI000B4C1BA4|nr:hypothetical protein [Kineosporia sp. A_224]